MIENEGATWRERVRERWSQKVDSNPGGHIEILLHLFLITKILPPVSGAKQGSGRIAGT